MITPKIKNLFQFVEFLHSNIENFKRNDAVMSELHSLREELIKLSPGMNFKEKLKLREVQAEIKDKFQVIQENIIQPIQAKANKLNICDPKNTDSLWNWNISEIHDLKENFSKEDLPEIFSHNKKYIEYRTKTKGEAFFGLVLFFIDLDKLLKKLFGFFTETTENEFKAFEILPIRLNAIRDGAEIIKTESPQATTEKKNIQSPDLTVAQTALFFYYLAESKTIEYPSKKDWPTLKARYKFSRSHNTVYEVFKDFTSAKKEIMTLKNLKVIIPIFENPAAKIIARKDYISLEVEP